MSWYKDLSASQAYKRRWPITVYNSGAQGNYNVSVTLPTAWDEFWDLVQSTGYDLRFTRGDGLTVLTHERQTWTYASHTGVFDLSTVPLAGAGVTLLWVYWGQASAADTTSAGIATTKTGQVSLHRPTEVYRYRPSTPGNTRPRDSIAKTAAEKRLVWVDYSAALGRRAGVGNKHDSYDELASIVLGVTAAGADQSAMYDQSEIVAVGRNVPLVGLWVQAGTTATDYTIVGTMTTAESLVHEYRARLQVRTTSEQ